MALLHHPEPAPAAVVARARQAVAPLIDRLWTSTDDDGLIATVEQVAVLRAALAALQAEVLVEIDHRELPRKRLRWASTTDWYAHCSGSSRAHAKRTIRDAHDLLADRRATRAALRAGTVSPVQASVICRGVADLPGDHALRDRAERVLLEEATRLDATDLGRAARRVIDVVDPDRADRRLEAELDREDRAAHLDRFLAVTDDGAGGVRVKGRGSLEDGAVLRAALLPLTKPAPATALVDPIDPAGLMAATGCDPRDHGARLWDALITTAQHALDTDLPPTTHATVPRVSVTIPVSDLLGGLAAGRRTGETDDGLGLAPGVVRRLACDAELIPVVLGTDSAVLDVGVAARSATPAIWRGLVVRDRHCAFPSCQRPPLMCHAHHVVHWADGGETSLANLVLLCGEHHRTVHHTPWRVRISPDDQAPEFLPPPRDSTRDTEAPAWIRHRTRNHPLRT